MIPKIIHYCWFGGKEKSSLAKHCINSWSIFIKNGYALREWNESNFDFSPYPVIQQAYNEKRYAFVSDFVRLKALESQGGIYLDTDVEVFQDFAPLLGCGVLLGMIYPSSIGTAVMGSTPGHPLICQLVECYETALAPPPGSKNAYFIFPPFAQYAEKIINNNDLLTLYFLSNYPSFRLGNKKQTIDDITIYPTYYFEGETFQKRCNFSRHYGEGSWYTRPDPSVGSSQKIKQLLKKDLFFSRILWDQLYRRHHDKQVPFHHWDKEH